ncbi:MAG: hypothetical protein G01um10143_684 [Parcubacteria group bacterium Gr01-1014_3]|nr:MAG: hypothetical protein G01um10143_684 [Parcubacteria group bacterium Gr01-1014_3]
MENPEKNIESEFEDRGHYESLAQKVKHEIFNDLDKYEKASEEMINFQKTNPEIRDFELWHTLIGSTPPEALVFDAPDRKISKFVDELAGKYLDK